MNHPPIYVTQPFLPPLEEFLPFLQRIWENRILTNDGPYHRQLEEALRAYLGVEHIALFANGTIALLTALKALGIGGEVITTPYTFVATAHSLLWENIEPVFVDIDPRTFNLDPDKIEAAITPRTTALLPVHCYGTPCDVHAIQNVADRHGLRVIYDAAHAFGVHDPEGKSLLLHGDISILSFHATKVFNTLEGGAIVCRDTALMQRINLLKNFGFVDEVTVSETGINGKMNELEAAFGLLHLSHMEEALARRKAIDAEYRRQLQGIPGIACLTEDHGYSSNHGYFPILVNEMYPVARDDLYLAMKQAGIHARRYFFPLVSAFPMYAHLPSAAGDRLPVARRIAEQVLCLPIHPGLTDSQQQRVVEIVRARERPPSHVSDGEALG